MRIALICLLFCLCGCQKELSCVDCLPGGSGTFGRVVYYGPVAGDGCEWKILVGSIAYHPENLDSSFMQDSLDVQLAFFTTGDFYTCGLGNTQYMVIRIAAIKEK